MIDDAHTSSRSVSPVWHIAGGCLLLAVVVGVAFYPCLRGNFINWDDDICVVDNVFIRDITWENLRHICTTPVIGNYVPLSILSYALDVQIYGLDPSGFRRTNYLLHIANVLLVYLVFLRLGVGRAVAFWTALFFGVVPLKVESVAWVTERKDVLYAFFYLAAMLGYIRYRERGDWRGYAFSLLAFTCALFSKSMAVTLPAILLLLDLYKRRPFDWSMWLDKIPFTLLSVLCAVAALWANGFHKIDGSGALSFTWERLMLPGYVSFFYVSKLLVPLRLSCIYPYNPEVLAPWLPVYTAGLLAVLAAVFCLARTHRALFFGVMFYLLVLTPVLQVVPVVHYMITADRYTYMASTGIFFVIVSGGYALFEHLKKKKTGVHILVPVIALVWACWFIHLTRQRCPVWQDSITLWTDTIARYPDASATPYLNRANAYTDMGRVDDAMRDNRRALDLEPGSVDVHYNLGNTYRQAGRLSDAVKHYDHALKIDPEHLMALGNRGNLFFNEGDYEKALADYNAMLAIDSQYAPGYFNRGNLFRKLGQLENAIADYTHALALRPDYIEALNNRGSVYNAMEAFDQALADYKKVVALEMHPVFACINIGNIFSRQGNPDEAIQWYARALQMDPQNTVARQYLEMARARQREMNLGR